MSGVQLFLKHGRGRAVLHISTVVVLMVAYTVVECHSNRPSCCSYERCVVAAMWHTCSLVVWSVLCVDLNHPSLSAWDMAH